LLLRWRSLRALLVAVGALLAAPVITQLGSLLGWWKLDMRKRTAAHRRDGGRQVVRFAPTIYFAIALAHIGP